MQPRRERGERERKRERREEREKKKIATHYLDAKVVKSNGWGLYEGTSSNNAAAASHSFIPNSIKK